MTQALQRSNRRSRESLCDHADDTAADERLIRQYIERDPFDLGPDDAQIVGHGVAVWALLTYLHSVDNDVVRTAIDYGLTRDAVEAAIRYYCRHQEVIDARICLNESMSS
jgi:uncharacterized protein (DUF433 family)